MSLLQWTSLANTINGTDQAPRESSPFTPLRQPSPTSTPAAEMSTGTSPTTKSRRSHTGIGVRFISDEVKRDHRDLEVLYKGLMQAVGEGDDETAVELQKQFSWELARHLVAMQLFIFPGTEQRAEQGNGNALKRRGELAAIRDHLLHFINLQPRDAAFGSGCEQLSQVVKAHIRNVERTDLRAIEKVLDGDSSERMARDWEKVGNFMPGDGRDPPFTTIPALLGARYDDLVRAWKALPQQGQGIIVARRE